MNDELAEIRISNLEQRIDRLVQELAQGKQGDNVQNAQLQPFVPIPRITGEDQKPFDIETDDDDAKSVVRCIFYWGKDEIELADYSLDELPATGNATLYLTRTISEGEPVYALTTDEPEDGDEDTAYYKIYDFTDGEVSCDYRATFLTLGISAKFVGDMEGSEVIDAANDQILVTGHPGEEDAQGQDSHSGILFLTVSGRTGQDGEKIPAKIIARIKDKEEDEDWGAKTMTVTDKDGNQQIIHFLGCDDVDIDLSGSGGGGGGAENVIGSDYIKAEDEEEEDDDGNVTTKRKVSAKIQTSDPNPSSPVEHALLTHDTDQLVRSKKTFLGSSPLANSKKVIVDGPNGRVEVQNEDGNRIIKLDAADIPNECGQGGAATIQVRKLTVTHPRAKNGKTADIYHVIGCSNVEVQEGDAIQSITSGTPTQSGGFTVTPVTITLKDGTTLPAFNVSAKNGEQGTPGSPGDDGEDASVQISTQDIVPTQQDPRTGKTVTITPYTGETAGTPVSFNIYDGEDGGVVGSIIGTASGSQSLNGQITASAKQGSGLVVKTTRTTGPSAAHPLADGNLEIDLAGRENLDGCQKNFGLHQLKYKDKDGNTQIYHVLSCGDIDLTKEGKLIKNTSVHISASPGGQNTIVFTYTDGSQDTFSIANGLNGSPGSPGRDGDTPEITSERQGSHIYIYADGDLIADIEDGHTPEITADKQGKVTTIYVDGNAVATINDGEDSEDDDELQEMDMVTGVTFELSGGKLIAKVAKKKVKAKLVSDLGTSNVDVCECKEVEVVTSESYSTTSHKFTNTRRKITVLKDVAGTNQTPFTATPLSSE